MAIKDKKEEEEEDVVWIDYSYVFYKMCLSL